MNGDIFLAYVLEFVLIFLHDKETKNVNNKNNSKIGKVHPQGVA